MADVMLRFDMRLPEFATSTQADMYEAAIEICAWGDQQQSAASTRLSTTVPMTATVHRRWCLPRLLPRARAICVFSALIAPLHDPVRLAEDLTVLDNISRGRVIPILSGGYREEESQAVGKKSGGAQTVHGRHRRLSQTGVEHADV